MPSRRRVLRSTALAALTASAGCAGVSPGGTDTGTGSDTDGDESADLGTSPYPVQWLPDPTAEDRTGVGARFADVAGLNELNLGDDAQIPSFMPRLPFELPMGVYWTLEFEVPGSTALTTAVWSTATSTPRSSPNCSPIVTASSRPGTATRFTPTRTHCQPSR